MEVILHIRILIKTWLKEQASSIIARQIIIVAKGMTNKLVSQKYVGK